MKLFTFIFFLFCAFFICCSQKKNQVVRSYYFWRSGTNINKEEISFLKRHGIHKLYARLLDVDWNEVYGAYPVASASLNNLNDALQHDSASVSIVPVIFITNKTFQQIDSADIPLLAKRIVRRCMPAYDSADIAFEKSKKPTFDNQPSTLPVPQEIQFDCDWTISTSGKYFYFLQMVRSFLSGYGVTLSATVRLHQYKYPEKTGIPPVSRGMLMVYNTSDPTRYSEENSIFEKDKARAYFTRGEAYPLAMDIALPAYSWCIIFRNQRFYQIENQISEADLVKCTWLKRSASHVYKVVADTVFNDLFLRCGDEIKVEATSEKVLTYAAELAEKAVNTSNFSVALFELSSNEIKNYSNDAIEAVYARYR